MNDTVDPEAYHVRPVLKCPCCGSRDLLVRIIPRANQARYVCQDCGKSDALKHEENALKRINNQAMKWAWDVKRADGEKCHICGSTKGLEAHHIIPVSNDIDGIYRYMPSNGVALCQNCHRMVHKQQAAET